MGTERIARAVLEIATDSQSFFRDTAKVHTETGKVDKEFEALRQRVRLMQQDLDRSVRGFRGDQLVAEALRMEKAIGQLQGGLATLTKRELAQVSATVADATHKLKAMGQEVPPALQKLQTEIAALGKASQGLSTDAGKGGGALSSLAGIARGLGPLLPIASVAGLAGGLVSLAGNAIETAGNIQDMADRLGVSTDAVQEMKAVADATGSSVEAFGKAAFKLGINVAEGNKNAKAAIADLGLEYERLRNMRPEEMHREVVRALEQVADANERNRLGVALYGKTFADIAPAVASGYSKIADSASKMTADQIAALDRLGDKWVEYKNRALAAAGAVVAGAVTLWEDTVASMSLGDISRFTEAQQSRIKDALGQGGEGLAKVLRDIERARTTDIELTNAGAKAQKDYAAALAEIDGKIKALKPDQVKQLNAAIALGGEAAKDYAEQVGIGEDGLDRYKEKSKEAETATKALSKALEESQVWGDGIAEASRWMARLTDQTQELELRGTKPIQQIFEFGPDIGMASFEKALDLRDVALVGFHAKHEKTITSIFEFTGDPGIALFQAALDKRAKSLSGTIGKAFKDLPNVIMRAVEGGGDVGKSIGAMFGSKIFAEDSALVKSLSGGLTKVLGKTIGGAIGSMVPGLGTLLGTGIGALADKLFGKLFGGEGKKVNDLRDQFTSAAGGIDKLAERAAAAGLTLDRFYRAKTVKEYQAAIDELNEAFTRLDARRERATSLFDQIMEAGQTGIPAAMRPAIEQLIQLGLLTDEQVAKLTALGDGSVINVDQLKADLDSIGGRLESLGPKFQQANLDKTAAKYINSIDRLIQAGGDVGGILFDAKDEISDVVNQSLKFGTTIPANMKPWIEELARAGLLLDANGEKITDTSKLKFGDPIKTEAEIAEEGWKNILKAIRELVDEIRGPLMGAINGIPDQKRIKVTTEYDDGATDTTGRGPQGSYAGGIYRGRFSNSGTLAWLHNVESVVPSTPRDEMAFALRVLAEQGATPAPSSNNVVMLSMPGGGIGSDIYQVSDEVMRRIPGGLETDRHFLRTSIERVVRDWVRTYGSRG